MFIRRLLCSCVVVCAAASAHAFAHRAEARANAAADPVAYVYVSATPANSSVNEIDAFAASADGRLTPVPGTPFNANAGSMAVNGLYLFASDQDGFHVDSYAIEPSGALALVNQTDIAQYTAGDCVSSGPLVLDHTGQTLYDLVYRGNGCSNNAYSSFGVVKSNGGLTNVGTGVVDNWLSQSPTFLANNVFAYSASCLGDMYWELNGMQRSSTTGLLSSLPNFSRTLPTPKPGDFWCPSQTAADTTGHLAVALQPVNGATFTEDGGPRIAAFLAQRNGNLTTTNTVANMPVAAVGTALSMSMAPSGRLLAVGGLRGLQVFYFNGSAPATPYTGVLAGTEIDQMFWDNNDHLYAISRTAGKLFVFTVTPTGYRRAPGSPYSITGAQNLIVQPWPLPWAE